MLTIHHQQHFFLKKQVGLPPFYQENTRKAYEMLLTMPIEFPDSVTAAAQQMIRALLNVDATKRLGRGYTF